MTKGYFVQGNSVEYKNFQIDAELLDVIKHMQSVEEIREKLNDLSRNWDSLSLLSQLGEAGVNMSEIKHNFTKLSSKLINHLSNETLKKSVSEMHSKAQVAVDIVIRNLFERTADIGFLSTDSEIRKLLVSNHTKYSEGYEENITLIQKRFVEYIEKYSVYSDIVLMNTNGDILANIDPKNKSSKSKDPLLQKVIHTQEEYVESYGYHDFLPNHEKSLVYSYKVTQTNDANSEVLGVLALCFRFEDEMEGIFEKLVNPQTKECLTLLDAQGSVIASSDAYHIPLGARFEKILDEKYKIITFGGREYLAKTCATNGYQGFFGLGWYGHIMIPLEYAFKEKQQNDYEVSKELLLAILQHGKQFPEVIKSIPLEASSIQNNLNIAIWNGNVKQSSSSQNKQFSRALLQEIRSTGENTKGIIGASIASLTKTMVLGDSVFLAALIVDIMDRNLYERANDCRWWALTPDFRRVLENKQLTSQDTQMMCEILKYINDLYTVYTNLFVYDRDGVVVAVSNEEESYLIGRRLSQKWVASTLALQNSSEYCVSDFEKTYLYGDKHSYIYNASIRSLEDEKEVLGGIGIVFDSQLQFESMIQESLPQKSEKSGVFALLATSEKMIISSSDAKHKTGEILALPSKFFALKEGESLSEIIEYQGDYYALGVKCSNGYREFKSKDDAYQNRVYSLFFSLISNVEETLLEGEEGYALKQDIPLSLDADSIDIATFMIGDLHYGVESSYVIEAREISEMKPIAKVDKEHYFKGTVLYEDNIVSVIDLGQFIAQNKKADYNNIVILKGKTNRDYIGILVGALGEIPSVHANQIRSLQEYIVGDKTLVQSMVFPESSKNSSDVLSILSVEKIYWELVRPEQKHMALLEANG